MVFVFSLLLIVGIVSSQLMDFSLSHEALSFVTSVCLAYIMIEVGFEFSVDKRSFKSYGWDFLIASIAAIFPAILWAGYFLIVIHSSWKPAVLSGLSAAPTSAGVLFAMMAAAGLGATWVFKKARVLAILDDLVTILLLTPLQFVMVGFEWKALVGVGLVVLFIFASFRWQNSLSWPVSKRWFLVYAFLLTAIVSGVRNATHIYLDVLIPAFMAGCLLHAPQKEESSQAVSLDFFIKGLFMFLVGLTFPKIATGSVSVSTTVLHVLALTILANVGKFLLVVFYKNEATFKERMALGVAMFPRGEVGAAVLVIGIGYGLGGYENTLSVLSLALNLILTGGFIWIVIRLLKGNTAHG